MGQVLIWFIYIAVVLINKVFPEDDVFYMLYDKDTKEWDYIDKDSNVPTVGWVPGGDLKLIIHGFNPTDKDRLEVLKSMLIIGKEYAKANSSLNIINVDWLAFSSRPLSQYPEAVKNVPKAADIIGEYLIGLKNNGGFSDWGQIHLIGFSLGAHVAGFVGQHIRRAGGEHKIGRITGVDPAGPGFSGGGTGNVDRNSILDSTDASYVDIIHCDIGTVLIPGLGTVVQSGHADFYPNGGIRQDQSCGITDDLKGCSHQLCPLYFAYSIENLITACPCGSWEAFDWGFCKCETGPSGTAEFMGEPSNWRGSARGKYFLEFDKKLTPESFN